MDTSVEVFHTNCLKTGNTNNCPVCYYIKHPESIRTSGCMKCDANDSLQFCIVCGYIGCGHSVQGHALEHYEETKHKYAMELKNCNVWDYKMRKSLRDLGVNHEIFENFCANGSIDGEGSCPCPVCRHICTPKLLKQAACMKCEINQKAKLWICLFCSYIGCGRHSNRHALKHYTETQHPYSMQLDTFSIWDYKENKYVHRQLHESLVKPEVVAYGNEDRKEDFERRMQRLELKWQELCNITEANTRMLKIEERLLTMTSEKKLLEKQLYEHDLRFNELFKQFIKNREKVSASSHSTQSKENTEINNNQNQSNQNHAETTISCLQNNKADNPTKVSITFQQSEFLFLLVLGFFICFTKNGKQ